MELLFIFSRHQNPYAAMGYFLKLPFSDPRQTGFPRSTAGVLRPGLWENPFCILHEQNNGTLAAVPIPNRFDFIRRRELGPVDFLKARRNRFGNLPSEIGFSISLIAIQEDSER